MKKAFIALAVTVAMSTLAIAPAAGNDTAPDHQDGGGAVAPCSLDGVNPAHHPKIFGNPAVAKSYGFVRSPDGTWHVQPNCRPR